MGLKNWLAKNIEGVSGYGQVMGREAVMNGVALGRTLYLGHGTSPVRSDLFVLEDDKHMQSEGFTLYCADPLNKPPLEDSSELSKHTRAAGIALACQCAITAAYNFMAEANAGTFSGSMGDSTRRELRQQGADITFESVMQYLKLPRPTGITQVVNLQRPGANDLLAAFLKGVSEQFRGVGFQRTGILGFDLVACPLAETTVLAVRAAAVQNGW